MNGLIRHLMPVTLFVFLIIGMVFGGTSFAGNMVQKDFAAIDANKDGNLTFDEYKTAFPSAEKKGFLFLDKNKDNQLDKEEWQTFTDMHKGMGAYHGKKKYHDKE